MNRLVFFLTMAVLAGCGTGQASVSDAPEATPVPVDVTYPRRADLSATYEATTTIGAEGDAPVLARVGGDIVDILVEEGDRVEQGDVLARLDGERLRLEMLAAKADLDKARGEYERYVDLHARGLVSEAMFEGLRYDLESLTAAYELARLDFEYSKIRATISGFVSERRVKLGENLAVGQEAFRITDVSELIAYLRIPQTELGKFAAGHAATLSVDSLPGRRFNAEIVRISPTIDVQNGTFRATAFIDNSERLLAPGMFARFSIEYETHENALTIPLRALLQEDDETAVYVVAGGQVERRAIRTGIVASDRIEVLDGLDGDDAVVIAGQTALREGSKVIAQNHDNKAPRG
ncbi:MAG: efflux RND transporter periplasmic adaptor subunit [Woeseiaceae bacterium]|nr:efflux RND transporter periplasmic adaptor subunit [Woeseiaceae bacterium]